MEIYLFLLIILFVLAISDLIVGVSNDAVNFLNSAIGAKVAPRHIILIVASLGILVGVTFSSGIMEVARKGIFHPDMFYFSEIMVIFLAVMITDVVLLDTFNTFALPTSTTVSIVFELLGSATAVSIIKIANAGESIGALVNYLNTSKALAIISGILLSVIVAFIVGAVVQYLSRLLFTFKFTKNVKYFGGLWGALSMAAITYFILIKGAKGTSFMDKETVQAIKDNTIVILLYSSIFWGIVIQALIMFTKINVFKPLVLIGTFALALAFAANDLVNFIGVPLAGFFSYNIANEIGGAPDSILMSALKGKIKSDTFMLLIAGVVMVLTLWFSAKARKVTKTSVDLSRQDEGDERFESSALSRAIVRMTLNLGNTINKIIPASVKSFIDSRFEQEKSFKRSEAAFDLIRASNNLVISAVLISFATSLKLPLSTTYVTFMVAMGTSFSDKAWGRDSAVYRINGVLTVVGGWFFTAFSAFMLSFLVATVIYYGELYAIIALTVLAAYLLIKSHILTKEEDTSEEELDEKANAILSTKAQVLSFLLEEISDWLSDVPEILSRSKDGLAKEDRVILKEQRKLAKRKRKHSNLITSKIFEKISIFTNDDFKSGKRFGKIITSLQEVSANLFNYVEHCYSHIENNHKRPKDEQIKEISEYTDILNKTIQKLHQFIKEKDAKLWIEFTALLNQFEEKLVEFDVNQISRIKENSDSTRNSLLFFNLLSHAEVISIHLNKLGKNLLNLLDVKIDKKDRNEAGN